MPAKKTSQVINIKVKLVGSNRGPIQQVVGYSKHLDLISGLRTELTNININSLIEAAAAAAGAAGAAAVADAVAAATAKATAKAAAIQNLWNMLNDANFVKIKTKMKNGDVDDSVNVDDFVNLLISSAQEAAVAARKMSNDGDYATHAADLNTFADNIGTLVETHSASIDGDLGIGLGGGGGGGEVDDEDDLLDGSVGDAVKTIKSLFTTETISNAVDNLIDAVLDNDPVDIFAAAAAANSVKKTDHGDGDNAYEAAVVAAIIAALGTNSSAAVAVAAADAAKAAAKAAGDDDVDFDDDLGGGLCGICAFAPPPAGAGAGAGAAAGAFGGGGGLLDLGGGGGLGNGGLGGLVGLDDLAGGDDFAHPFDDGAAITALTNIAGAAASGAAAAAALSVLATLASSNGIYIVVSTLKNQVGNIDIDNSEVNTLFNDAINNNNVNAVNAIAVIYAADGSTASDGSAAAAAITALTTLAGGNKDDISAGAVAALATLAAGGSAADTANISSASLASLTASIGSLSAVYKLANIAVDDNADASAAAISALASLASLAALAIDGVKRAVLIGINYTGNPRLNTLSGCINDVVSMRTMLINTYQYKSDNVTVLRDDDTNANTQPTRKNIINSIKNAIKNNTKDTDELWIHYSGHGSFVYDEGNDEVDRRDEGILPSDFDQDNKIILDDELKQLLNGVQGTVMITQDCCNSGTGWDLPYMYTRQADGSYSCSSESYTFSHTTSNNIYMLSGSRDDQLASETDQRFGAFTAALMECLNKENVSITLFNLENEINKLLVKGGYKQRSVFTSANYNASQANITRSKITSSNAKPPRARSVGDVESHNVPDKKLQPKNEQDIYHRRAVNNLKRMMFM